MDGWYVRELLLTRDLIRSSVIDSFNSGELDEDFGDFSVYVPSFDDSTYDDLLTVEIAFKSLSDRGLFTDKERVVTLLIMEGYSISSIAKKLKIHRDTVNPIFKHSCRKIAFYLGDYFTNEGFLTYMSNKYNLTAVQKDKIEKIMEK